MPVAPDSIRQLTRAYIGARVYQGFLFCCLLIYHLTAILRAAGYAAPRLQIWITLTVIVTAGTLGTYLQWRFGRVEAPRPSRARQVVRGAVFAVVLITLIAVVVTAAEQANVRPMDLGWVLLSAGTGVSLAISRGRHLGVVTPLLASALLLSTIVVPALQPYRGLGHGAMAAALLYTAVQLHLFVVRGFRHAHV